MFTNYRHGDFTVYLICWCYRYCSYQCWFLFEVVFGTAFYKCQPHEFRECFEWFNMQMSTVFQNHGKTSSHRPELVLNNFNTRLGHSVGRLLAALFPYDPQFQGRRCITFHNQRDFIFFRHHRYIFKNKEKVGLQELGPRFTLKLRWLQKGAFDTKFGEYEWIHKRKEMDTSRRKFHL